MTVRAEDREPRDSVYRAVERFGDFLEDDHGVRQNGRVRDRGTLWIGDAAENRVSKILGGDRNARPLRW